MNIYELKKLFNEYKMLFSFNILGIVATIIYIIAQWNYNLQLNSILKEKSGIFEQFGALSDHNEVNTMMIYFVIGFLLSALFLFLIVLIGSKFYKSDNKTLLFFIVSIIFIIINFLMIWLIISFLMIPTLKIVTGAVIIFALAVGIINENNN